MDWAIQYIDESKGQAEAEQALAACQVQVDYLGGRVLAPGPGKPNWRAQVFFEDAPDAQWLPDGCRRVLLPLSLARTLKP